MRKLALVVVVLAFGVAACSDDSSPRRPDRPDAVTDTSDEDGVSVEDVPVAPDVPVDTDVVPPTPDADVADEDVDAGDPDTTEDVVDVEDPPLCVTNEDCDDGNLCTIGTCEEGRCIFRLKNCTPDGANDCDDWFCNPVTGTCDVYEGALCPPLCTTNPATCEDGNPCTTHSCDPIFGCQYAVAQVSCSDGNPCTVGDRCVADPTGRSVAICEGGSPRSCDDGDDCTINWCDPTFPSDLACRELRIEGLGGDCAVIPCPDGQDDECPVVPNPCMEFVCNADVGVCEMRFTDSACDDNNPCTTDDRCLEGVCVGGPPLDCDDGVWCSVNSCVPERGGCVNTPIVDCPQPCATAGDCPASDNPCVRPVCTPAGLCYQIALTGSCDNGNLCTEGDYCENRRCVAGPDVICDDLDICTRDRCDSARGCVHEPIPGCAPGGECVTAADCDDGDPCTVDSCLTYLDPPTCYYLPRPFCSCNPNAADGGHGACDWGNPCILSLCEPNTDASLPYSGLCSEAEFNAELCCDQPCDPANNTCDDGDKCTLNLCEPGPSAGGAPTYCCLHPPVGSVCGRPCSTPGQESIECSDGDPCTINLCGADGTCDLPVTDPERCECTSATVRVDCAHLDDGNPCTDLVCQNRQCVLVNHTRACDDGNFCTVNTVCSAGECVGNPRVCPVSDPCHDPICDPATGCSWEWNFEREGCADTRCSIDAQCVEVGICEVGRCIDGICQYFDRNEGQSSPVCVLVPCSESVHCDDGNPCTTGTCATVDVDGVQVPIDQRVCLFEKDEDCSPGLLLDCAEAADCEPITCQPDDNAAFCRTAPGCVDTYCDADLGCRYLTTASCPFARDCTPSTAYLDCWDQNPCTKDLCTPDGDCDNSQPVYAQGENLFPLCQGCLDASECGTTDLVDLSLQACVQVHCRQFGPLHPEDAASGVGVCWAEFPAYDPADNLWEGCQPCALDMPCDPTGQAFLVEEPCATYSCRQFPLAVPFGGRTSVGVCWAELDTVLYPNLCEDYDLCTVNACLPDGSCSAVSWFDDCRICGTGGDCDDRNACTFDECVDNGFRCTHTPIEGCIPCETHMDCPDADGCDLFHCSGGVCRQPLRDAAFAAQGGVCLALGCDVTAGVECDDGEPSTLGVCLQGSGDCVFLQLPDFCVPDLCLLQQGSPCNELPECVNGACSDPVPIPGCQVVECSTQGDCNEASPHHPSLCFDGVCWAFGEPGCQQHADCVSDGRLPTDACTVPVCTPEGSCDTVAISGTHSRCGGVSCDSDVDCAPGPWSNESVGIYTFCLTDPEGAERCYDWPCAKGRCVIHPAGLNTCLWFEGDCKGCTHASDCEDGDPCTVGACEGGTCVHTRLTNCTPTACGPDNPCASDDPCRIGVCLSDGCLWLPNPLCRP